MSTIPSSSAARIRRAFPRCLPVALALAMVAAPAVAGAQYFGRNKVNYERFDFRVMQTPNFDLHFYPAESLATADAARMLERWHHRLSTFLNHTVGRRSIILFADQGDFQQNNVVDILGEGTGGVTEGFRERVVLPFTGSYADNDHVLGHELVHVFQYDMARRRVAQAGEGGPGGGTERGGGLGLHALPLWFVEGMAEYLAIGRTDANTAMWLRDAVRRDDFPTLRQLTTDTRYFPYRYGQAFWAYVGGRYGDQAVPTLFRRALASGIEPAIRSVLRMTPDSLSREWEAATRAAYEPMLAGRTAPEEVGTMIVRQRARRGGEFNVSPVVSPDGRHIAFFSSRGLFAIQVFIADAETGRVIRQLGSINTPAHYDALSFINSAGTWSPDGRRLAYVVYQRGDQVIEIYNLDTRRSERVITAPGVGAAVDPAWSPDGRFIAFTGLSGGISNIYLYDLSTDSARQLTTGRNADFQPTWSPDGSTIVFSTDRGEGTDFTRLTYRPMRLASLDVATGQIRLLPALPQGKAINPQYSPDGRSVYFVSDADGVPDIYRLELASGNVFRVTRVASGVSGITRLSPALSVARQTGRLVFTLFRAQGYDIVRLEPAEVTEQPIAPPTVAARAAMLPPETPTIPSAINGYLADATSGLPPVDETYAIVPYRSRLRLDYVAPPVVGVSFGGPFGTQLGGGIAASFSDQLGNHNVLALLQAEGELRDLGGLTVYQNFRQRWNYGFVAGRIPYRTGRAGWESPVIFRQEILRVYYNQLGAFAQYPFSPIRRVEFSVTANRQTFRRDVDRFLVDPFTGVIVDHERFTADAPEALSYVQGTAALVGDYSFFGLTSPIAGGRYRFDVSPVFGSLNFTNALADYRRYLFARPVTFAARGMHYGRYGRDSDDTQRLTPVFVGQPWLVRGYDPNDFRTSECLQAAGDQAEGDPCPAFNRLIGSRIAVANAEIRIPVLGPYGFGLISWRFLPLEVSPFFDAGVAWRGGDSPSLRFATGDEARETLERVPVFSTGLSARTNLFGFAVLEAFYVHPFQRPDRGRHWGFQLAPGW